MRKQRFPAMKHGKLAVLGAALGLSMVIGGCGKKHEKIDLEQTTEAVTATMEETKTPGSGAVQVPGDEAGQESGSSGQNSGGSGQNSGGSGQGSGGSGQGAGAVVKPNAVTYTTASYTAGKVSIQYPVMEHLEDSQSAVNDLIRLNALAAVNAYVKNPETDALEVACQVLAADKSRITIVYTGTALASGAAHPVNLLYSSTIDVRNASNLDLPQMADPKTLAEYVMSEECVYSKEFGGAGGSSGQDSGSGNGELLTALNQLHKERGADWYEKLFQAADFPASGNAFPSCFSFEKDGDIYVSIPVPHALGDYAVAVFTPENK